MERVDQAVALLKQSKSRGMSFYDARQALARNGFTDTEIADAADRFNYEDNTISSPQPSPTDLSLSSPPTTQLSNELAPETQPQWFNTSYAQLMCCSLSILFVWYAGGRYDATHSAVTLLEFLGVAGLSALTIVYYGFVAKVMIVGRYRPKAYSGNSATIASLVWLAALSVITFELLK